MASRITCGITSHGHRVHATGHEGNAYDHSYTTYYTALPTLALRYAQLTHCYRYTSLIHSAALTPRYASLMHGYVYASLCYRYLSEVDGHAAMRTAKGG